MVITTVTTDESYVLFFGVPEDGEPELIGAMSPFVI